MTSRRFVGAARSSGSLSLPLVVPIKTLEPLSVSRLRGDTVRRRSGEAHCSRCEGQHMEISQSSCRRQYRLAGAMLLLCWMNFLVFLGTSESFRRYCMEASRLVRKLIFSLHNAP